MEIFREIFGNAAFMGFIGAIIGGMSAVSAAIITEAFGLKRLIWELSHSDREHALGLKRGAYTEFLEAANTLILRETADEQGVQIYAERENSEAVNRLSIAIAKISLYAPTPIYEKCTYFQLALWSENVSLLYEEIAFLLRDDLKKDEASLTSKKGCNKKTNRRRASSARRCSSGSSKKQTSNF